MKLPDFLEKLNQGALKAFGENAQAMIDSLLYAKLPPKLKRSTNMARLENATYEEIVTHLERELELNGLEEGDDIPVPTRCTAPTAKRPGTGLLSSGIDPNITATIAKNLDMSRMTAENLSERRNNAATTGRIPKKNIQNVQLATKRITRRIDVGKALEPTSSPKTLTGGRHHYRYVHQSRTRKKNNVNFKKRKKLGSPRLQIKEKLRVRQYIRSDPPNIYYTEYYTTLKETSSADWQQQMKTPPTFSTT